MRKRQKLSLFLTVLLLCGGGTMQAQEMGLFVHRDVGAPQSFALSGIGKITFSGGSMTVSSTSGASSNIALSEISPPGIYVIQVKRADAVSSQKIIKN